MTVKQCQIGLSGTVLALLLAAAVGAVSGASARDGQAAPTSKAIPQATAPLLRCPEVPTPSDFDPGSQASMQAAFRDAPRLFRAFGANQYALMKQLLAHGDDPTVCVRNASLLSYAASLGDLEALRLLLDAGARTERPLSAYGNTALLDALSAGRFAAAQALIARGADATFTSEDGGNALHALAMADPSADQTNAQAAMVQILLQRGVPIDAVVTIPRNTALMHAALRGNQPLVEQLLRLGANPKLVSARGDTALSLARKQGHANIVALLAAATQ